MGLAGFGGCARGPMRAWAVLMRIAFESGRRVGGRGFSCGQGNAGSRATPAVGKLVGDVGPSSTKRRVGRSSRVLRGGVNGRRCAGPGSGDVGLAERERDS